MVSLLQKYRIKFEVRHADSKKQVQIFNSKHVTFILQHNVIHITFAKIEIF